MVLRRAEQARGATALGIRIPVCRVLRARRAEASAHAGGAHACAHEVHHAGGAHACAQPAAVARQPPARAEPSPLAETAVRAVRLCSLSAQTRGYYPARTVSRWA